MLVVKRRGAVGWVCTLMVALGGCGGGEERGGRDRRCEQLREHVVDLRLASVIDVDVDVAKHRIAMVRALGDDFVTTCVDKLTNEQLECALTATDAQAVARCH